MNGIFNILKPSGMTSHDVVAFVRKKMPSGVKVGHTGTLDPAASGVLPICTGKATRIASFFLEGDKGYRAVVKFGITTDTLDGEGKVIHREVVSDIKISVIEDALNKIRGEIEQTPPAFSAVRHKGKHLYELARKGESVAVPPRKVTVYEINIADYFPSEFPELIIDIRCSHGTYIRSIASNLGEAMNCGAHLSFLVRTFSGPFEIKDAVTINEFEERAKEGDLKSILFPMDTVLNKFHKITVKESALKYLINGNMLYPDQVAGQSINRGAEEKNELLRIYDEEGNFWGLGRWHRTSESLMFKTEKLLRSQKEKLEEWK